MKVFLVDGTYELFRQYFGRPSSQTEDGREVGAVQGVLASTLALLESGATHIGVATDHVIESFRNRLWPGYKTGSGIAVELLSQFTLLEEALVAMGIFVWPMVELEADDALASAAAVASADERVEQVAILTPDKDLAQCVQASRVVQVDRRNTKVIDEGGVIAKFGVPPVSIPDYLALVGDSADGYPGIAGWGAKSTATVLAKFGTVEAIPVAATEWGVPVRSASTLAASLQDHMADALLFKDLATLRRDPTLLATVDQLHWAGPTAEFSQMCKQLGAAALLERAQKVAGV